MIKKDQLFHLWNFMTDLKIYKISKEEGTQGNIFKNGGINHDLLGLRLKRNHAKEERPISYLSIY